MKRGLLIGLGVVLLVVGVALAALGTFVATSVGSDESLSTSPSRVRSAGVAVVAENLTVDDGSLPVPGGVGSLTLSVTARDGRQLFLGAGSPSQVRAYLKGAPYSTVVDLSAGAPATTRTVPGTSQPAAPGSQTFWTVQSTGAPASVTASLAPGAALVVMNADGTRVVDADLVVTLRAPHAWARSWIAAGVGLLLVFLSLLCFWRARAARRRARTTVAPVVTEPVGIGITVLPGAPASLAEPSVVTAAAEVVQVEPVPVPEVVQVEQAPAAPVVVEPALADEGQVPAAVASPALAALVAEASGGAETLVETGQVPVVAPQDAGGAASAGTISTDG